MKYFTVSIFVYANLPTGTKKLCLRWIHSNNLEIDQNCERAFPTFSDSLKGMVRKFFLDTLPPTPSSLFNGVSG